MTYTEFCQTAITSLTEAERLSTEITFATGQEIQWRKGYEVRRAIRHKGVGIPTRQDLDLLQRKTNIVISQDDRRRARVRELVADHDNAERLFPLWSFNLAINGGN